MRPWGPDTASGPLRQRPQILGRGPYSRFGACMASWPADSVERRPVASLVPYARNARTHSDEQVAQIAGSIREWGWTTPVLVDEEGGMIAGHGRVTAGGRWAEQPCPGTRPSSAVAFAPGRCPLRRPRPGSAARR